MSHWTWAVYSFSQGPRPDLHIPVYPCSWLCFFAPQCSNEHRPLVVSLPPILSFRYSLFVSTRSGSDPWRQPGVDRVSSNSFPFIFLFFSLVLIFFSCVCSRVVWTADNTTVLYSVHLSRDWGICLQACSSHLSRLRFSFDSLLPQDDSKNPALSYLLSFLSFAIHLSLDDVRRLTPNTTTIQLEWDRVSMAI